MAFDPRSELVYISRPNRPRKRRRVRAEALHPRNLFNCSSACSMPVRWTYAKFKFHAYEPRLLMESNTSNFATLRLEERL